MRIAEIEVANKNRSYLFLTADPRRTLLFLGYDDDKSGNGGEGEGDGVRVRSTGY